LVPERKDFYVYVFLRSTDSLAGPKYSPYYVGKGKGNRAYSCQRRGAPRPKDSNFIAFIEEGLTEAQAFALEKYCIALYGRIDLGTGVLRNLTDGGDGVSGIVFSSETIKRLSDANLGKTLPQETKDKISAAMSGRKLSEKTKQLISEGTCAWQIRTGITNWRCLYSDKFEHFLPRARFANWKHISGYQWKTPSPSWMDRSRCLSLQSSRRPSLD
jgi:hypothetical protein